MSLTGEYIHGQIDVGSLYSQAEYDDRECVEDEEEEKEKKMTDPKINQKVLVLSTGEVGTITAIYPPCKEHSGRITVYLHSKSRSHYAEFWYSDINKSLIIEDK